MRDFDLPILGTVAGRTNTTLEGLAEGQRPDKPNQPEGTKNVTNLGLPLLGLALHIVCPKDSQRYYLLFTWIHRLFAPLFTTIRILLKTSTLPHRHDSTKTRNSACLT
jgi:hypothetical protein